MCIRDRPNTQLNIWRKYLPECMYVNMYGPTEATDIATYYICLLYTSAENAEKTAKELSEKYGVYAKGYGMKIFDEENTKEIFTDIKKQRIFS